MKKIRFVFLSFVCFSLIGCSNTDITVRPHDSHRDYWIGETIDIQGIDASKIYEESAERILYLDSNYRFQNTIDGLLILPKESVTYYFSFRENDWSVSSIYITDPNVKVFGLMMNSSKWKIRKTLKSLGFEYFDKYSGLDPCYLKENIKFRIYPTYISISCFIPNY